MGIYFLKLFLGILENIILFAYSRPFLLGSYLIIYLYPFFLFLFQIQQKFLDIFLVLRTWVRNLLSNCLFTFFFFFYFKDSFWYIFNVSSSLKNNSKKLKLLSSNTHKFHFGKFWRAWSHMTLSIISQSKVDKSFSKKKRKKKHFYQFEVNNTDSFSTTRIITIFREFKVNFF